VPLILYIIFAAKERSVETVGNGAGQ